MNYKFELFDNYLLCKMSGVMSDKEAIIEANKAVIEAARALKTNADKLASVLGTACGKGQIPTLMTTNYGVLSKMILEIITSASEPLNRLLSIERVLDTHNK